MRENDRETAPREQLLDVSDLDPCEPLERTLAALRELPPGRYLRVLHRREPLMLYPLLEKMGFVWQTVQGDAPGYQIFIWRDGDRDAEPAVRASIDPGPQACH